MSDTEDGSGVRVTDRRRFDEEGNARDAQAAEPELPEDGHPDEKPPGERPDAAAPAEDPVIAHLRADLDASRKRVDELARAYQAVVQDREEFKQRLSRERERMMDVERGKAALALLEGIDELDRCLASAPKDDSPLAQGVRLIRTNLLAKVQQTGIERMDLVGKPFDPNVAEAVDMEITPSRDADQTVVAEVAAGYRLRDRVVRPAKVKVARYIEPAKA